MGFTIGIEATKACNFTCGHCFVDAGKPHFGELTTDEMKQLISDLIACGCNYIGWSGGEALLRKDLEELSEHGFRLGARFGIASNGFVATKERLTSLRKVGNTVIQISLDGNTDEKAHRFRKGPSSAFERAVQAVRNGVEVGMNTWVCSLLSPETAGEIEEMIAFSKSLGAVGLRYTMLAPVGRAKGEPYREDQWKTDDMKTVFQVIAREKKEGRFKVQLDCPTGPYPGKIFFRCPAGHGTSYVTAVGDVYPCTALMTDEYKVGNIRQTPLHELLFSHKTYKIQREIAATLPEGDCTGCGLVEMCRGGCPGRTLAAFGHVRKGVNAGGAPVCLLRLHPPKL